MASSLSAAEGGILGGALMVLVGLGLALWATRRWRLSWLWLGAGAVLWFAAVLEKWWLDAWLRESVLGTLQQQFLNSSYLVFGSAYVGLLSGVTEVAIVFVAAKGWRPLAGDARRAAAIGLGAGAFEAVYFGLTSLSVDAVSNQLQAGFGESLLIPAVERLLVIPCHVAVRMMALYAVATGRWRWFWGGFILFSALDAVAGFYHLSHTLQTLNPWLIELSFLPFAVLSLWFLPYLWRHWPSSVSSPTDATRASSLP